MKNRQYKQRQFTLLNAINKVTITKDASQELVNALLGSAPSVVIIEGEKVK